MLIGKQNIESCGWTHEKRKMEREQYVVDCCGYPFGLEQSNLSKLRFHGFRSLTKVLKLATYKL